MKRLCVLAIAVSLLTSCERGLPRRHAPQATEDASVVVLENDFVQLTFDRTKKGNLARYLDKTSGRTFLSPNMDKAFLYQFVALDPDGKKETFSNTQAKKSTISFRRGTLTISNSVHREKPITVTVTCTLRKNSPLARWRIQVDNQSDLKIREIIFPCIRMKPETDYVLFPTCDGCIIENPAKSFRKGYRLTASYPGSASCQVMAGGLNAGGLYFASHDSRGDKKAFHTANVGSGIELSLTQYPTDHVGNDYKQRFDVATSPFTGSWYTAADIYKLWAVKQHWCRRLLVDRRDVPAWLKRAPMFITVGLKKQEKDKPPVSLLANARKNVKSYSDYVNRPMCALLGAWHGRGYYISPHYFPPYGGNETFTELTHGLRADGNHSLVFLCGLFWTVEKKPPVIHKPYNDWERFKKEGQPHAIVGPDGKTYFRGVPDKRIGQNAVLCPATRYTPKLMRGICKQCQKLGITMTQIETVGGGVPICYATNHRHKPGGGNYNTNAIYDMYKNILWWGQLRNKDYVLSIEEPGEYFIQVLSSYHSRDSTQRGWPRSAPGARGVPLFTYLYHEYALGYGGHGAPVTDKQRRRFSEYMHGAAFVCGKTPAISEWSNHIDAPNLHPDQMKLIKGIAAILDGPARDYLMLGRMLHPLDLNVPKTKVGFWSNTTRKTEYMTVPAVLHSAWQYPPVAEEPALGKKRRSLGHGYAFVNISDQDVEFTPDIQPPLPGKIYTARQYGNWLGPKPLARTAARPLRIRLRLKPGESTFIELVAHWRNPVMPGPED